MSNLVIAVIILFFILLVGFVGLFSAAGYLIRKRMYAVAVAIVVAVFVFFKVVGMILRNL